MRSLQRRQHPQVLHLGHLVLERGLAVNEIDAQLPLGLVAGEEGARVADGVPGEMQPVQGGRGTAMYGC